MIETNGLDLDAINAASGGHSIFAPSGSAMWLFCSGSLIPNVLAPDNAGEDAAEGTVGHAVAEEWLTRIKDARKAWGKDDDYVLFARPNDLVGQIRKVEEKEETFEIEITEDMLDFVQEYVQWCMALPGEHYIETRVDFSQITPIPRQGGTADHAACEWQHLTITDLKYGRGVPVYAENNTQELLYSLGFFYEFDWLYNFQTITLRIAQPRRGSFTEWTISRADLLAFAEWARERAAAAWVPDAPRTPGFKTCTWCKVRGTCPAWLIWFEENAGEAFDDVSKSPRILCYHPESDSLFYVDSFDAGDGLVEDVTGVEKFEAMAAERGLSIDGEGVIEGEYTVKDMTLAAERFVSGKTDLTPRRDPAKMDSEALAKLLPYRGLIEKFFADVQRELEARANDGEDLTKYGYKLVPSRAGRRTWRDEQEADELLDFYGVGFASRWKDVLVSPAVAQDLVRKSLRVTKEKAAQLIDSAVNKPPNRQTLAPVTDDRLVLAAPADDVFENVSDAGETL